MIFQSGINAFASAEGIKLFSRSQYKHSFFVLSPSFQAQINEDYCAVASAVILLNARQSFTTHTQMSCLGAHTDSIKDHKLMTTGSSRGMTLAQLTALIHFYGLNAKSISVSNATGEVALFQEVLKKSLLTSTEFVICNFSYQFILGSGGGHFSPVAAYDEVSNNVLILDVARHKSTWFWVPLQILFTAMCTKDGALNRGYIHVSK